MPKNKVPSANSSENNSSSFGSPNQSAFENDALGFVYKNLINRDPNKRKIKPVESILSMDADFDDSESDDSDYQPINLEPDDVEIESDTEDNNVVSKKSRNNLSNNVGAKKRKGKTKDQGNNVETVNVDDSDDDGDDEDDDDDEKSSSSSESDENDSDQESEKSDNNKKKPRQKSDKKLLKTNPNVNISSSSLVKTSLTQEELASSYKKILICAVCLGDVSHYEDEIVECDACGISVHELCYGITADDTESIHSDASSASTEPWFCDPCKAGVREPLCQLCPTLGGIFKIATNGRWVHMVCALYTPSVTFIDPEKLRGPILTEINYSRWGSKLCMLCEDDRFSQTGVCICCDAGMCKTYFHVTCAQREGLLLELRHSEEVDPFIAYCRLHSDKAAAKKKRQNYHALVARYRFLMKTRKKGLRFEDSINNQRTLNKLFIQRRKFNEQTQSFGTPAGYTKRTPRFLDASPSLVRRLVTRSELSGISYSSPISILHDDLADIRKKWHIQPAFSVEFISYYIDRNERISQMRVQSTELTKQNTVLKEKESEIFTKFNQLLEKKEQTKNKNDQIRSKIRRYFTILSAFLEPTPSTSSGHDNNDENDETNCMKLFKLGQRLMNLPEMKANQAQESTNSDGSAKKTKNEFQLKECATCSDNKEQHMMALCDSCHLYYHLQCLDPPLRRMPKKTRFGGWQCSNCTENEEQNEMDNSNELLNHSRSDSQNGTLSSNNEDSITNSDIVQPTSARRKLRENPKTVSKYTEYDDASNLPGTSSNNHSGKRKDKTATNSNSKKRIKNRTNTILSTNALQKTPNDSAVISTDSNNAAAVNDNNNVNNNSNKSNNRRASRKKKTPSPKTLVSPASSVSNEKTETIIKTSPTATNVSRKRKLNNSPEISLIDAVEPKLNHDDSDSNVKTKVIKTSSKLNATVAPTKRSGQAECYVCRAKLQSSRQSVRCDDCGNDYHFGCLKPPMTKSPKRRGYTWCCFVCEKKDQKRLESASTSILATSSDGEIKTKSEQEKSHQSNKVIKKRKEKAESTTTITLQNKKFVNKTEDGKISEFIVISPLKKVSKAKQEKIVEISLLQKADRKPEKEIIIIDEDEEKEKEANVETNPVATILNVEPTKSSDEVTDKSCPEQSLPAATIANDNVNSGINELKPPPLLANHNSHHDKDVGEDDEIDQPAISNNNANNIDDINTVLNDIIMLEEEAQNTKKQQQQEPTIQDTVACAIITEYNNEKPGTDKLAKEIGMMPAQQQSSQPEVITTTNGGDSMLKNDKDTEAVVGGGGGDN